VSDFGAKPDLTETRLHRRELQLLGHNARLMPAKYVRPYSKGQKNDFRDAEAIAEAVQRPTMKFVATKTADQLGLQALHRVPSRECH
jgi:transposase